MPRALRAFGRCDSNAGLTATSTVEASIIPASTTIAVAGSAAPESPPANAGPITNDRFRLEASVALAWSSSSGPAISASALKNVPELPRDLDGFSCRRAVEVAMLLTGGALRIHRRPSFVSARADPGR